MKTAKELNKIVNSLATEIAPASIYLSIVRRHFLPLGFYVYSGDDIVICWGNAEIDKLKEMQGVAGALEKYLQGE